MHSDSSHSGHNKMIFNVCLTFTRTYVLVKLTNFSMEMLRSVHIQSFVLAC